MLVHPKALLGIAIRPLKCDTLPPSVIADRPYGRRFARAAVPIQLASRAGRCGSLLRVSARLSAVRRPTRGGGTYVRALRHGSHLSLVHRFASSLFSPLKPGFIITAAPGPVLTLFCTFLFDCWLKAFILFYRIPNYIHKLDKVLR